MHTVYNRFCAVYLFIKDPSIIVSLIVARGKVNDTYLTVSKLYLTHPQGRHSSSDLHYDVAIF